MEASLHYRATEGKGMSEPTRPMKQPLRGDTSKIPELLDPHLDGKPLHEQLVISVVGSAARRAGNWVGVSIQATCIELLYVAPPESALAHETAWMRLYGHLPAVAEFRKAQTAGWITIADEVYAYPTQKLADFVCGLR